MSAFLLDKYESTVTDVITHNLVGILTDYMLDGPPILLSSGWVLGALS
jgi:hypothetical protein